MYNDSMDQLFDHHIGRLMIIGEKCTDELDISRHEQGEGRLLSLHPLHLRVEKRTHADDTLEDCKEHSI